MEEADYQSALKNATDIFQRELATLMDIGKHPHIVRLKRVLKASGQTVGMALRLMHGGDVSSLIK